MTINSAICRAITAAIAMSAVLDVEVARATTYYVRKSGNDVNTGLSPGAAFQTINAAAQTMMAGDSVWIGAGTYSEQISCPRSGNGGSPISFLGDTTGAQTSDAGSIVVTSGGTSFNANSC